MEIIINIKRKQKVNCDQGLYIYTQVSNAHYSYLLCFL